MRSNIHDHNFQTVPHATPDADFVYTLVEIPRHGRLFLSAVGQDLSTLAPSSSLTVKPVQMGVGSTFTQLDLLAGHLKYRLMSGGDLRNRRKPVEDGFKFKVETKEQARQGVEAFRCKCFTLKSCHASNAQSKAAKYFLDHNF